MTAAEAATARSTSLSSRAGKFGPGNFIQNKPVGEPDRGGFPKEQRTGPKGELVPSRTSRQRPVYRGGGTRSSAPAKGEIRNQYGHSTRPVRA